MISKISNVRSMMREEGSLVLFKHFLLFLKRSLPEFCFPIYESTLDPPDIKCEVDNLTLRVITCPEEIDNLCGEGFCPTRLLNYKKVLSEGAILFCAFVGKELAHAIGVFTVRGGFKSHPFTFAMDDGHTVGMFAGFTAPKYRRNGIHVYTDCKMLQYLRDRNEGILRVWSVIPKDNLPIRYGLLKAGYYLWGKGYILKLRSLFTIEWVKPVAMGEIEAFLEKYPWRLFRIIGGTYIFLAMKFLSIKLCLMRK